MLRYYKRGVRHADSSPVETTFPVDKPSLQTSVAHTVTAVSPPRMRQAISAASEKERVIHIHTERFLKISRLDSCGFAWLADVCSLVPIQFGT
jgi:hypothetical protein